MHALSTISRHWLSLSHDLERKKKRITKKENATAAVDCTHTRIRALSTYSVYFNCLRCYFFFPPPPSSFYRARSWRCIADHPPSSDHCIIIVITITLAISRP